MDKMVDDPEEPEEQHPTQAADNAVEPQPPETPADGTPPAAERKRLSTDEALAEMRRSLREEEVPEKAGFAAFLGRLRQRLFHRKREALAEELTETPSRLDELAIPQPAPAREETATPQAEAEAAETTAPASEESEFESMVRRRLTGPLANKEDIEPAMPEAAPVEEIEEPRPVSPTHGILTSLREEEGESKEEELSALRKEALEDYVAESEAPEDEGHTSLSGRLQRSWRYMRPIERRMLIGALIIVALAVVAGSGFLVVKSLPAPTPTVVPTASIAPIPISVSLPGGWIFPLRTGAVVNGKWNPQGPEWLGGTEVCRWVSLPWTIQLEAVLRTLKSNDEIRLSMSNYDSLVYKVQSIEQVPASEINKLASDTPCLLVILSKQDADTRWVVTAKP